MVGVCVQDPDQATDEGMVTKQLAEGNKKEPTQEVTAGLKRLCYV